MSNFDDIRPYNNSEMPEALKQLTSDQMFMKVLTSMYSSSDIEKRIRPAMEQIQTIDDFQAHIIYPLLKKIETETTAGISYSTMEQFNPDEPYLFISNHRDIILDAAFLNAVMHVHGFKKTEIAIGDNLLIYDWIKILARINRAFIVKRNLGIREQLHASQTLSKYIRYSITQKNESVWIAQREGRTKDGNDQTQAALLKMLNMSNKKSITLGFKELNIVPMAISYEFEPCGISKIEELLKRKYNPDFEKTQQDDLQSMANGVMQPKGRVHFGFGNPLNIKIDELTANTTNNESIQNIVNYIDKRIYANYKLWPNNYIASDLLFKSNKYQNKYSDEEKNVFVKKMNADISTLEFKKHEATQMYLSLYANPVINHEKHF
jgi:1-acyl-sn-glycerol-3-phosphate acyltransferase